MRVLNFFVHTSLGMLFLYGGIPQLHADITVRLSVKFILNADGTRPTGGANGNIDISTTDGFDAEIVHGNRVLAGTGRGYTLEVDYPGDNVGDIQPSAPSGQASDYWFNLDARSMRQTIENAALADKTTWRWDDDAINIYVNNSSSGSCSVVGQGLSISLGGTIFTRGTVIHEVGHFFDLKHTHPGDPNCGSTPPPYMPGDGDGLEATVPDHNCLTRADLMAALPPELRESVDTAWLNVMSYHREEQLLDDQMDIWSKNANDARVDFCSGRTWFVAVLGFPGASGMSADSAFGTVARALLSVSGPDDVILLRSGVYSAPQGRTINTPCTLRATRGPATVQ